MKILFLTATFLLLATAAISQINLPQFNTERVKIIRNGMLVLGSWATANMVIGAIALSTTTGETRYFHQMNLIWGSVNLAIAGSTYLGLRKKSTGLSLSQTMLVQSAIEKTFLVNGGLDLVYLMAGLYCMEKSKNQVNPDKYRGYGKSLFVQGGGLLLFDIIMYVTHLKNGRQLYKILDKMQFSGNSAGILWRF